MKFNFKNKDFYGYACTTLSLIGVFWCISLFEALSLKTSAHDTLFNTIFFKFINDFWVALIVGILLFPVYLLLHYLSKKYALNIIKALFVIIIIIQFSLVKYSVTTLLNLGADLLGYSFDDIYNTVSASESLSVTYFIPYILFPILLILFFKLIEKFVSKRKLTGGGIILIVLFGSAMLISYNNTSNKKNQNKIAYLTADIIKYQKDKINLSTTAFNRNDYPLLKPFHTSKDVLSPFFNMKEEKPNIVVLIVEGLGTEFIGHRTYGGFTPYLDGLISKSLYWDHFVSTTGRTFGVLPSLLGSLPFGDTGFMEVPQTPSHISLISVLKANGYTTSYYSGDRSGFDKKINFLEYNEIENIVDESKYEQEYIKTETNSGGFSWGYPDAEIFKKTLASLDDKKQPRLDIIMTLSNHEPFKFPNKELHELKVDSILNANKNLKISKEEVLNHKDIYATLNYTDASIKDFMTAYAKRKDYNNTIFIITGDHRLIPISQKDKLCRFHVPLYIYSPLLKKAERFKSVSSHWDVAPSILAFLAKNYKLNNLEETAWMGEGLDTARQFRNIHKIPLMRYKGSINDYMYQDYLYSDGELFKIKENFNTSIIDDEVLINQLSDSLMSFKKMNAYVTQQNKIFPDSLNIYMKSRIDFSEAQLASIKTMVNGLSFDETFEIAREKAFNKEREKAQLLCDYILNELPNHADARTLKGRTLAWDGYFEKAEAELLNVVKRSPFYYDSYLALLDMYWWSGQEHKSEAIFKKAIKNKIKEPELSFKMAQAYLRNQNTKQAIKLMDSIINKHPNNTNYLTFKKTLQ
ncbi:sulfatase-like hydrolase/transferase [Hwangdonia seohaensis]|uniref:Sulfatase-like hydrolase/transferase n=1 Tax=Hwangdonia seohaensis TaxID=1240727 RepID=A0ABW3R981_9FLAO|nr:sulfatase-like hydrolase/transferase [Hwangdonia seohaensis]